MTNVTQHHLVEVLKTYCHEVADESASPRGYEKELMKHIAEIVSLERNNIIQQGPIQKKIADKVDTLGKILSADSHKAESVPE